MDSFSAFEAHRIALVLACLIVAIAAAIGYDARTLSTKEPREIRYSLYQYSVAIAFFGVLVATLAIELTSYECTRIPDSTVKAVVGQLDPQSEEITSTRTELCQTVVDGFDAAKATDEELSVGNYVANDNCRRVLAGGK